MHEDKQLYAARFGDAYDCQIILIESKGLMDPDDQIPHKIYIRTRYKQEFNLGIPVA